LASCSSNSASSSAASSTGLPNNLELDVAIVGAGPSGVYTGYRLVIRGLEKPPKVAYLRDEQQVDGRRGSVVLPGMSIGWRAWQNALPVLAEDRDRPDRTGLRQPTAEGADRSAHIGTVLRDEVEGDG
jgi:hypothetical protein